VTVFAPLLGLLEDVPDPRRAQGKLYQLPHVLLFSILAIVTGANSYRGIGTFIKVHGEELNIAFRLTWRRAPTHTAIRYILQRLDPVALEAAFRRHAALLQAALATAGQVSIAIDGKTLRGSFDNFKDRAAAQILSAFATETALVLAHLDIAEKSNEIPAAQAMLATLGIPAPLVTLDALHCQKKTFEAAAAADAMLIVQVKDNQPTLHQQAQHICTTAVPLSQVSRHNKGRNRDETRVVTVFDPAKALDGSEWQSHVAAIIRVERGVYTRSSKTGLLNHTSETAFYVANAIVPADTAADATRGHWSIENGLHYSRDVTLREDASRIRSNPGLFARLRSFAYNILKANRIDTLAQDRYRAALGGLQRLLKLLAVQQR
jgi:predicted transposase YbfD/YdcC